MGTARMIHSRKLLQNGADIKSGIHLSKGEYSLLKYIRPDCYIEQNLKKQKIERNFLLNYLQKEMHDLLNSFLNSGYSKKSLVFYPIIKDVSKESLDKLKFIFWIAEHLTDDDYDFSNSLLKLKESRNKNDPYTFALLLSSLYKDFSQIKKPYTKVKGKKILEFFNVSDLKRDSEYVRPLAELQTSVNNALGDNISAFYLHGSFGTKDYVKYWSDVDTFAVINKSSIMNPNTLLNLRQKFLSLRELFLRIDPLQHHGCMIATDIDLEYYPETFFPIAAMNYSKSLLKKDFIKSINVRDSRYENISTFFWFVHYFKSLNIKKSYKMDSYSTKFFLHCITLFPTIYLQAKGINVYKKFSFDLAKKDFPEKLWEPIAKAGQIRKNWRQVKVLPFVKAFGRLNPLLSYYLNSKFFNVSKSNGINIRYLVESMDKTSEYALSVIIGGLS